MNTETNILNRIDQLLERVDEETRVDAAEIFFCGH